MAGELFVIQCTTCNSRLKVRDGSAIGQILACPKCSGMVLVQPPPGFEMPAPSLVATPLPTAANLSPSASTISKAATAAITETVPVAPLKNPVSPATPAAPVINAVPRVEAPTKAVPATASAITPAAAITAPSVITATSAMTTPSAMTVPSARATPPAPVNLHPPAVPATDTIVVHPQHANRQPASLASGDSFNRETMSDSDFGDVDHLLKSSDSSIPGNRPAPPPPAELAPRKSAAVFTPATLDDEPAAVAEPVANEPIVPDLVSPGVKRWRFVAMLVATSVMGIFLCISVAYMAAGQKQTVVKSEPPSRVEMPPEETTERPVTTEERPVTPVEKTPDEATPPPAENPPKENNPPPEVKTPPDPVQPDQADKPDPLKIVDAPPAATGPAGDPLRLADLRKFERLLNTSETPPADTPPSPPVPPTPETAFTEPLPRPEMRKINAQARIQDRFVKLDCQGRPLSDFLEVVSEYSTIPITLDPAALSWLRISPELPLTSQLSNVTVLEALQQVLAPLRLEPVLRDNQILITRPAVARQLAYPCDGLVRTPQDLAALEQFVRSLSAPDAWKQKDHTIKPDPAAMKLGIQAGDPVHMQVLELLERLRVARGLKIRSNFPVTMFPVETRWERARVKLEQPLSLNYAQPVPLKKIVARLHAETGLHVLVDWFSLAGEGWPDDTEASVIWDKTPLGEALSQLLQPMDLDYRVIDEATLQIVSRRRLAELREIEFYRIGDLLGSDETPSSIAERLLVTLGEHVIIRYDAPSKSLFVLASQPDQRQLAALLNQWRHGK